MKPKKPETLQDVVSRKTREKTHSEIDAVYIAVGANEVLKELRKRVRKLEASKEGYFNRGYNFALENVLKLLRWK